MANDTPELDNRTSAELVEQAKKLIPQFTPEWTNLNDSDPGMTLVKVHAWLSETLLYQINRLPQQNYDKFIELLGVKPMLASTAKTDLAFKLSKDLGSFDAPLLVSIPLGAKSAVDDPELQTPVIFESTRTLTAVNAAIGALVVPNKEIDGVTLKTEYNAKTAEITVTAPFFPFGDEAPSDEAMYIGLALRPHQKPVSGSYNQDRWPECEINLTVAAVANNDEYAQSGENITDNSGDDELPEIEWAYYSGGVESNPFDSELWHEVFPQGEGRALDRNGHVSLKLPASIPLLKFEQLNRAAFGDIGALRVPTNHDELLADIEGPEPVLVATDISDDQWKLMFPTVDDDSIYDELLNEIKSCCSSGSLASALENFVYTDTNNVTQTGIILDPVAMADIPFNELNPDDYALPSVPTTPMIWLRVRPKNSEINVQAIDSIYFNTVAAEAKQTYRAQRLGVSDGKPNQTFKLPYTPLLFDVQTNQPKLSIISVEQDAEQSWQYVSDFYLSGPDSFYFTFDPLTQSVQFGDGIFGAIPGASAQVYVEQMEVGGGLAANVGPHTITKLKRALKYVDSVTNPLAAYGGRDTESLKQTRLRAAHEIKHRDRAVTADDFSELAKQTPSVPIHSAFALANTCVKRQRTASSQDDCGAQVESLVALEDKMGAVTVVVLPKTDDDKPQPTDEDIKAVCEYLNPRRLITTELYVVGPEYVDINCLSVNVSIFSGYDTEDIAKGVQQTLLEFFHPVKGGRDGDGWPFGEDIYLSEVYCRILDIEGVSRAYNLTVAITQASSDSQQDDEVPPVDHEPDDIPGEEHDDAIPEHCQQDCATEESYDEYYAEPDGYVEPPPPDFEPHPDDVDDGYYADPEIDEMPDQPAQPGSAEPQSQCVTVVDRIILKDQQLVYLSANVINIKVAYEY